MIKNNVISVDLGGTKILSAMLNLENEIIDRVKIPTDISKGPKYIVECIAESVKELLNKTGAKENSIKAVSLGVPGTVNPNAGLIAVAPNLDIVDYNIKKALQKWFDIPVLIENDVNLAALGIKRFEFNDDVNNMLVVFVGTGIGGALIFNGCLYRGSSFYAGEIGHMRVSSKGEFGISPKDSTFENIASRTAIIKSIIEDIKEDKKNPLNDVIKAEGKIKSKALANAVKSQNKIAVKHVNKACTVIGSVLGSITTLINLDTIVLGGGVVEAMGDYVLPLIEKSFHNMVLPEPGKHVKLVVTKLGDDAPLYGGIGLANEFLD